VPSLSESLDQVMTIQGARAAALIDIATGMILQSVGQFAGDFPAAAAGLADEAQNARGLPGAEDDGDLDEISLITASRLQVSTVVGQRSGEGLLLFVDLDRARVNMALALRRIGQLALQVLA
jgi:hypothetical protein